MAKVATAAVGDFKNKFFKKIDYTFSGVSGVEILHIKIKSEKHKRKLNKILLKNGIEYVVTDLDTELTATDGRELLRCIYPEIIKSYTKTHKIGNSASVYADRLDDMAREVIFLLCDKFKYISVFTSDYNKDKFFDEVMDKKGVGILTFSENKNETAFVLSDKMPAGKEIVDLKNGSNIKIYTPDKKVITPALCEAVLKAKNGGGCDLKEAFASLKFKVI